MTLERSHGKARPALVRASDLRAKPTEGRTPDGRFMAGKGAHPNRRRFARRHPALSGDDAGPPRPGTRGVASLFDRVVFTLVQTKEGPRYQLEGGG